MRYRMSDLDIREISYVGRPANRRKYIFIKSHGGDNSMDVKLEDLNKEDRKKLEAELEKKLIPDLRKDLEGTVRKELEVTFTKEKHEEIAKELKVDIEQSLREEFGKQDAGVSTDVAAKITAALKDISRGMTALGALVGYGYKTAPSEVEIEDLKKKITELGAKLLTKEDLEKLVLEARI